MVNKMIVKIVKMFVWNASIVICSVKMVIRMLETVVMKVIVGIEIQLDEQDLADLECIAFLFFFPWGLKALAFGQNENLKLNITYISIYITDVSTCTNDRLIYCIHTCN